MRSEQIVVFFASPRAHAISGKPCFNPVIDRTQMESYSADKSAHSSFASGRVGNEGRNTNWRLFGRDVPWIFSEIITQVNPDRTVKSKIKTSVYIVWDDDGTHVGDLNFNNLNIYKKEKDTNDVNKTIYVRRKNLPMNGKVKPFINSVPLGTWNTPQIPPSVQP